MAYVTKYGKNYPTQSEYNQRQANYERTSKAINALNADPNITSTHGHNNLSDLSQTELASMRGYNPSASTGPVTPTGMISSNTSAPVSNGVDWYA